MDVEGRDIVLLSSFNVLSGDHTFGVGQIKCIHYNTDR